MRWGRWGRRRHYERPWGVGDRCGRDDDGGDSDDDDVGSVLSFLSSGRRHRCHQTLDTHSVRLCHAGVAAGRARATSRVGCHPPDPSPRPPLPAPGGSHPSHRRWRGCGRWRREWGSCGKRRQRSQKTRQQKRPKVHFRPHGREPAARGSRPIHPLPLPPVAPSRPVPRLGGAPPQTAAQTILRCPASPTALLLSPALPALPRPSPLTHLPRVLLLLASFLLLVDIRVVTVVDVIARSRKPRSSRGATASGDSSATGAATSPAPPSTATATTASSSEPGAGRTARDACGRRAIDR